MKTSGKKYTPKKEYKCEKHKTTGKNLSKGERSKDLEGIVFSTVTFSLATLIFFLILIPGENWWLCIHNFLIGVFGISSLFLPLALGYIAVKNGLSKMTKPQQLTIIFSCVLTLLFCSLLYVFSRKLSNHQPQNWAAYIFECYKNSQLNTGSGLIGGFLGALLVWAFGKVGARISNLVLIFVFLMLLTRTDLKQLFEVFKKFVRAFIDKINDLRLKRKLAKQDLSKLVSENSQEEFSDDFLKTECRNEEKLKNSKSLGEDISKVTEKFLSRFKEGKKEIESEVPIEEESRLESKKLEKALNQNLESTYNFPNIEFLNKSPTPKEEDITSELNHNGRTLVDTLKSFNVQTKIVDISRGPAVTRYELQPASGVKISKITNLADDIALNLAASGVRIEAPIPGKAAVGVEIPNKVVSIVGMRELISSNAFRNAKSKLTVVLGKDISGEVTIADLAKMPHLLIAGSTGSGKSVCINSFIISLLYNATPSEVKLLMIDPKVVELGIYNGIPHLLVPVVTDARKAAGALGWAVNEMIDRYKRFAENNVRDISSYNALAKQSPELKDRNGEKLAKMPQVVIIIDELSDLMMVAPNEVEDYICRLAQMARAAGMYLVIATQRPSVDVITGIIKANIPSRIALAVSSQIDSRTILDMSGAEKLLGRGDMLFSPAGCSKPIRVQGCYVTDKEIEKVIDFIKTSGQSEYDDSIVSEIEKNSIKDNSVSSEKSENDMDPIMKEAIRCVIEAGQASTSLLQRRLRVGYARAGRLIDEMEQMGIVGPHEGSKPRQVLMSYQQFLEMNINKNENN